MSIIKMYFMAGLYISFNLFLSSFYFYIFDFTLPMKFMLCNLDSLKNTTEILLTWETLLYMAFTFLIISFIIFFQAQDISDPKKMHKFVLLVFVYTSIFMFLVSNPGLLFFFFLILYILYYLLFK